MSGALKGVKIVEMASVVLGPYAGQMLADHGADVVKVEPPGGDTNRNLGPSRKNADMSSLFMGCNRNKRSIVLDLKSEGGKAACHSLIKQADVVLHNYRPQSIERLGFGYDEIVKCNPNIVYCGAYGYSIKGAYGEKGALDDSIQAASGIAMLVNEMYGEVRYLPTIVADKTTGMMAAQSILAALFHRERTGEGQQIEVPMFETMAAFVMTEHMWGKTFEPPLGEAGYVRLMASHRRPYETKDGLYLAVLPYWDNHWLTFAKLSGHPELAENPDFKNMKSRLKNINASYKATGEVIKEKTRQEWLDLLGDTNVPMVVVNSLDTLLTDEHLVSTGFWQEHKHPTEGKLRFSSPPANLSKTPASIDRLPPRLGEHTREILAEVGYADGDIDQLVEQGDIFQCTSI